MSLPPLLLVALLAQPLEAEVTPDQAEQAPAPIEPFEEAPAAPTVKLFGAVRARLGVDTRFESAPGDELAENVVDLRTRAHLGADVKLSPRARLFLEGRLLWRGGAQRGLERAKGLFEPSLGEAFVDLYAPKVDLRIGQQVVAFGANPLAPADALNPRDLREGLLAEPEDGRLPAFAVRGTGELGRVAWTAAYFPFFTPSRYVLFGQDEALMQPGLEASVPTRLHESVEDELQPHLLETERPKAFPHLGDLGLRAVTPAGRVKLGASWVWMNEKLPQVHLDSELSALLPQRARGQQADPALALSVQNRLAAGEELFTGRYARQHLLSAEASALAGPAQLDFDLTYSPRQTFVDERMNPVSKPSVTWVVGVSPAEDSRLVYAFTYLGIAVPEVGAQELLLLVEPATARGVGRTAFLHLLLGSVSYTVMEEKLELSVRGAFEPIQGSFALSPRVAYKGFERVTAWLAAELYEGSLYSPFGYFGRNDQIVVGVQLDLL